jgi:hypothetical protein
VCLSGDGFVVCDHDDGEILFVVELFEEFEDAGAGIGIEVSGGFICEEDFGFCHEGSGDSTALHFASGEFGGSMFESVSESDLSEDIGSGVADLASMSPVAGERVPDHERGHDIFEEREFGEEVIELEDESEDVVAELIASGWGEVIDAVSIEEDFADVGGVEESHDMQEGALAGPAFADDGDEFSALGGESCAAEDGDFEGAFVIGFGDGFGGDQGAVEFERFGHG